MDRLRLLLAAAGIAALAACAPKAALHDKAYYAAHGEARAATIAACNDNPGGAGGAPDCANAAAAEADAQTAHFYDATRPASRPASRVADPGHL